MEKSAMQMQNQKRGWWLVVGLGVLLALAGVLVWHSQTVAKAQFALGEARVLLEKPSEQNATQALLLLNQAAADNAKAVALRPDDTEADIAYANALNMSKQYRCALEIDKRAIILEPENPGSYFRLWRGVAASQNVSADANEAFGTVLATKRAGGFSHVNQKRKPKLTDSTGRRRKCESENTVGAGERAASDAAGKLGSCAAKT